MKAAWSAWDAFADYHGLDPHDPTDAHLVAFVRARALAGVGAGSISSTLAAIRLSLTGSARLAAGCLTLPAQRQLVLLHQEGQFDPAEVMAPLLTVGQVFAMVEAGVEAGTARGLRDAAAVAVVYGAALRPEELRTLQADHVGVLSDGTVRLQVRVAKTGDWRKVDIDGQVFAGCRFGRYRSLAGLIRAYAETVEGGPWLRSVLSGRPINQPGQVLTAAAGAAGVGVFAPYSLRRSAATHAFLRTGKSSSARRLLRHVPGSLATDRYVEAWRALGGLKQARETWLDEARPAGPAVPACEVRGTPLRRSRAPKLAFVDLSVADLLAEVDLAALRTTVGLVGVSETQLAAGKSAFRRWSAWAQHRGHDPLDPPQTALALWVAGLLGEGLQPATVRSLLRGVDVGAQDATGGRSIAGIGHASAVVDGALRRAADEADRARGVVSDPASAEHIAAAAALLAEPALPVVWASEVLALATGSTGPVEVVEVDDDRAVVKVGRRRAVLEVGPGGLVCPVLAAQVLADAGVHTVAGKARLDAVVAAGLPVTVALRDRALLGFAAASGARPSDLSRARVAGVEEMPGGIGVWLSVAKDTRLTSSPPQIRFAADDVAHGDLCGADALRDWVAWWPYPDGWLFPDLTVGTVVSGELRPLGAPRIGARLTGWLRQAGAPTSVSAYGLRYAAADRMVDAGVPRDSIRIAFGHSHLETTRGYLNGGIWWPEPSGGDD